MTYPIRCFCMSLYCVSQHNKTLPDTNLDLPVLNPGGNKARGNMFVCKNNFKFRAGQMGYTLYSCQPHAIAASTRIARNLQWGLLRGTGGKASSRRRQLCAGGNLPNMQFTEYARISYRPDARGSRGSTPSAGNFCIFWQK